MTLGQAERDRLAAAETVLVLAAGTDPSVPEVRRRLLDGSADPRLLAVVLARPPGEWLADWKRRVGDLPRETVLVVPAADGVETPSVEGATVEAIVGPADFTGLGVRITERIGQWRAGDVRFCLDSLTEQCRRADLRDVYRFLHVLVGHLREADARAQFYLDPAAVDERTAAILTSLFDGVAEREDGEWSVRVRPD